MKRWRFLISCILKLLFQSLGKIFITLVHGFHKVSTRAYAKNENLAISEEIGGDVFKAKEEIMFKFHEKLEQQMIHIDRPEGKLDRQSSCINKLGGQLALQKNVPDQLEIKCYNNEQYSRLTSIPIHGMEVPENESTNNVMAVLKEHEEINAGS